MKYSTDRILTTHAARRLLAPGSHPRQSVSEEARRDSFVRYHSMRVEDIETRGFPSVYTGVVRHPALPPAARDRIPAPPANC